jgi:tripartite-type tricarboxylate transporter receptor subunit TctC
MLCSPIIKEDQILMPTYTRLALVFAAVLLVSAPAAAQRYPTGPIRLVVPFPPGGTADPVARAVAQKLTQQMGQQVIVDNRSGGSTIIGTEIVAKAPPDGHTLLSAPFSFSANPSLFAKLPYDPLKDFVPITFLGATPIVLIVHPSFPARSVKELIALAKAKPGDINYGSAGNGTSNHLAAELFNQLAGIKLTHVPYKGAGPATVALVSGEVVVGFPALPSAAPHIKNGRARPLAVASRSRARAMPDLLTMAEAGVPGGELEAWHGIMAPVGTPPAIIARLSAETQKALKDPEITKLFDAMGFETGGGSPEDFARFIRSEMQKWEKVIRAANIRID